MLESLDEITVSLGEDWRIMNGNQKNHFYYWQKIVSIQSVTIG